MRAFQRRYNGRKELAIDLRQLLHDLLQVIEGARAVVVLVDLVPIGVRHGDLRHDGVEERFDGVPPRHVLSGVLGNIADGKPDVLVLLLLLAVLLLLVLFR